MFKTFCRGIQVGVMCALLMVWQPAVANAAEQITSFNSHITVNQDTSVLIQETIHYTTTDSKHGIYRYIPTRYTRQGLSYTARVKNIKITDEQNNPIQFEKSFERGNIMLKIGDPDRTFTGPKTYILTYQVENAVNQVKDASGEKTTPELFWDITGEGWQVTIAQTTATLNSPHAIIGRVVCYAGEVGTDNQQCKGARVDKNRATFTYQQPIEYGENVTIAVELDAQGNLRFPTPTEKLLKQIQDNLSLIPLALPGLIMLGWWWKRGRDQVFLSWNVFNNDDTQPQGVAPFWHSRPIPLVYEPIKELTPGEAGAIMDEKVHTQDIIAEIIELAHLKFLKIERIEKKKLLILNDTDYVFTKLKDPTLDLPTHQSYLLEKIFKNRDTVKLSDLKGDFATHMEKTKELIFKSLVAKGLFKESPSATHGKAFGIAIGLLVVTGWWGIMLLEQGLYWALVVFGFSAVLALWAAYHLPAKTAKGTNFAWQAKGLRRSIQYGEWREKIKEKHLFFEEVLPFAIALGVVDRLARDMEKLKVKAPEYLAGSGTRGWSTHAFVNSFTTQASSNLTYNPNSSSWSSGSGFSGGSSGGGGGGGGGGSW